MDKLKKIVEKILLESNPELSIYTDVTTRVPYEEAYKALQLKNYAPAEINMLLKSAYGIDFADTKEVVVSNFPLGSVLGEGRLDSPIIIVGEAPGVNEVHQRRPFVGESGKLLNGMLNAAGITRSSCYITNLFKLPVQKKEIKKRTHYFMDGVLLCGADGFTQAGHAWVKLLLEEINAIPANVIVALGDVATLALTGYRDISKRRGSIYTPTCVNETKVIPTYHPAFVLRSSPISYNKLFVIQDLVKAKKHSEFPEFVPPQRNIQIATKYTDLRDFIMAMGSEPLAFDIEVINHEISCFAVGNGYNVLVVPLIDKSGCRWTVEQEVFIWSTLESLLRDPSRTIIGQNILFDLWVVARNHHIFYKCNIEDVMVMYHKIAPRSPKGLDTLTSLFTEQPYYKDEGKIWFKYGGTFEDLWHYNALDVAATFDVYVELESQLKAIGKGFYDAYRDRIAVYPALLYMELRGIATSILALQSTRSKIEQKDRDIMKRLEELAGREINPGSTQDVARYFYGELGIKPLVNRKTKAVTTDDMALKRLARGTTIRKPLEEASLILESRALRKLRSAYLNMTFDVDSRFKCSFNPAGTVTGRLSSSKTLFGVGGNTQNLPQEFKQFLRADKGYVLIEMDKKQAEWVVVAYLSGDQRMISVVEEGKDAHVATATFGFGVPEELILKENKIVGHLTNAAAILDLRKKHVPEILKYRIPSSMSLRQSGKKGNHGFNYGQQAEGFSLIHEIPLPDGKISFESYHRAYPGITATYYPYVRSCLATDGMLYNLFGHPRKFTIGEVRNASGYDHIPQSTVAELINRGLTLIYNDQEDCMRYLELLSQVHDSILFQYPISQIRHLPEVIRRCRKHIEPELEFGGRKFVIQTEMKIGLNWSEYSKTNSLGMREVDIDKGVYAQAKKLISL